MRFLKEVTFTPKPGNGCPFTITLTADVADWIDRVWAREEDFTFYDARGQRQKIQRSRFASIGFGGIFPELRAKASRRYSIKRVAAF